MKDREAWRATVHGVAKRHDLVTEQQEVFIPMCIYIYVYVLEYTYIFSICLHKNRLPGTVDSENPESSNYYLAHSRQLSW